MSRNNATQTLPPIPEKRYFSISETAKLCDVVAHVLRFWEQEFPELTPTKGRGGRRYYQHKDVLIARKIRDLLYNKRFTIEGAKQQLRSDKLNKQPAEEITVTDSVDKSTPKGMMTEIIAELQKLLIYLKN